MKPVPASHLRIARPSHDLRMSERFWVGGLGLTCCSGLDDSAEGGHPLLMVGWPDGGWHLELVGDPDDTTPATPTRKTGWSVRGGEVDEDLVRRPTSGGTRVAARNPYRDQRGVTIADPQTGTGCVVGCSWPGRSAPLGHSRRGTRPNAGPVGGGVADLLDEPVNEGRFGLQEREPVFPPRSGRVRVPRWRARC